MDAYYEETGSARVGVNFWISHTALFPFATLRVTANFITLEVLWIVPFLGSRYQFAPEDIQEIHKHYDWRIFPGIQITHLKQDYPPYIVYNTDSLSSLQDQLKQFGYEVSD